MKPFKYPQTTNDPSTINFFGRPRYMLPAASLKGYGHYTKNFLVSGILILACVLVMLATANKWFGLSGSVAQFLVAIGLGIAAIIVSLPAAMGKTYFEYLRHQHKDIEQSRSSNLNELKMFARNAQKKAKK